MSVLILWASGATWKHVVQQLLNTWKEVKAMVRSTSKIPDWWGKNSKLAIITASISEMDEDEMVNLLIDCEAVVSCLGHNLTFTGMFLHPRKLVTDAMKLVYLAREKMSWENQIKIILMNTVANTNRWINETISTKQKVVIRLLRTFFPLHLDNEQAADYLRLNPYKNWVAVRPDALINEDKVTEYIAYESPIRSGIFDPGKTSRINVWNFMMRLILEEDLWNKWKWKMPVLYNKE